MKVILINNYNLLNIFEQLQAEQHNAPAQHLWGYTELDKYGIQPQLLPFERYRLLKQLGSKLKVLGDIDQQVRAWLQRDEYDVIYSGHHLTTVFLSLLRSLRLLDKPIVAIAYQAPQQPSFANRLFSKLFVSGNDKILCLSEDLRKDMEAFGVPSDKLAVIEWGVDLRFYDPDPAAPSAEPFILSSGKTYRDYPTLIEAFSGLNCRLKVCAFGTMPVANAANLPDNIEVVPKLSWQDLIDAYRQSYAVAIPIDQTQNRFKNAIGLTNLTEAMAMGKAVVMTHNDYVGVDLEKEKIGFWVAPHSAAGWRQAIEYLVAHPEETREMGDRARHLAEKKFNLDSFASQLAVHLHSTAQLSA